MHDFVSHILRRYFDATSWNEYNSYLHLTSSSAAILDFPVPTGLSLSISASPTPPFFTTYRLGALPNLRAGIGYIYASTHNPIDFGNSSKDVKLKEIIERFRIVEAPRRRMVDTDYYWLGGERFAESIEPSQIGVGAGGGQASERGEYLVYGCMHVPSARLDALWTKRLSPTLQLIVTAVSTPPKYPLNALNGAASVYASGSTGAAPIKSAGMAGSVDKLDSSTATLSSSSVNLSNSNSNVAHQAAAAVDGLGPPGSTNLQLTLQRDTGRWFTEYSYSVDDALWGFRVLHNFGTPSDPPSSSSSSSTTSISSWSNPHSQSAAESTQPNRVDSADDPDAASGLRGRFSAGAEVFVSTVEKSAGLSTGIRFSTLPDAIITPAAGPSQPPTVITATLNPMMGHLSTAYAARMARDVVVASRFDFNVYSYESEWTIGGEYWLRGHPGTHASADSLTDTGDQGDKAKHRPQAQPQFKTMSLHESTQDESPPSPPPPPPSPSLVEAPVQTPAISPPPPLLSSPPAPAPAASGIVGGLLAPITGVLKARISTTSDIRLLWQGRLSSCLVSLGVKADLSSPSSRLATSLSTVSNSGAGVGIVKSIGLEVTYFSAAEAELD